MLEEKLFHSVTTEKHVGKGTAKELLAWLEKYVNVLIPDNGIEYWSNNRYGNGTDIKPEDRVPAETGDNDADRVDHAMSYVVDGSSEGRIIHIALLMRDGTHRSLGWIKSFGGEVECWQVARAISVALNHLLIYQELPRLVEYASHLPKQYSFERKTNLTDEVVIQKASHVLSIATDHQILAQYDYTSRGDAARFYFDAMVKDWQTVLTNMGARWRVEETGTDEIVVPELSGYRITNRAPGITGFYVLPPGGNAKDDRDWLGYYESAESAIEAAKQHMLNAQSNSGHIQAARM